MMAAERLAAVSACLLLCALILCPQPCAAHSYAVGMPIPMLKRSQYKGVSPTASPPD